VFQGNPKIFDFETALRKEILNDWTVTAHKTKIKTGDKVILWIGGNKAGCYALAEVTSEPHLKKSATDSRLWKEEDNSDLKADIRITHSLLNSPILKTVVDSNDQLKNLKVGSQGTNFSATADEYNILLNMTSNKKKLDIPLNQILYGPPGTGKTYNTVLEAGKIVSNNALIFYGEALEEFNRKLGNQIEFITFHQNYSYEDFIQGIRPDTENGKELSFEKKDGVFKRIADRALKNITDSEQPEYAKKDFDAVFQDFILPLIDEDEIEVKMKKTSFYITQISEKSIEFRKNQGDSQHTLSINTLRKMYNDGVNEIILGGLQPYYNPILQVLLEKGKSQFTPVEKKNFVIIIDEINRANISRVFGELITLIEEDKRSHGKIPMRVTLPSGDTFIVPSNLYIIGTMNTADKSIALLDIALRRRFEFVAKYPDTTVDGVHDGDVLLLLNKAIQSRKGYDFTIGHAYFMGDDYTLENTVNKKVIPLLLEYFMNNEDEVIKIFKEANITIGGWPLKMIL
jgi:5-methylcytosine-specific restriction protein B